MEKADDLRRRAQNCRVLARSTETPGTRVVLLEIADEIEAEAASLESRLIIGADGNTLSGKRG